MKLLILFLLVAKASFGQTFINSGIIKHPSKIHEITLKPDSTFEFWSRPHTSCLTWRGYKGTWRQKKDTLFFFDNYEVVENDLQVIYSKEARPFFLISFKPKSREIKLQYIYDHYSGIQDSELVFSSGNLLEIPFKDIPYFNQLSAIKIEYEKRSGYLTENEMVNIKKKEIPNTISVEFVEKPRKEIVYRTIKAVVKKDMLVIVSTEKTKSTLPDNYNNIEFEDRYVLK